MNELTQASKMQITKYLSQDINKIGYDGIFRVANAGKNNYEAIDILNYLVCYQFNIFTQNKQSSKKLLEKYALFAHDILMIEKPQDVDSILVSKIIKLKDEYIKYCNNLNIEVTDQIIKSYETMAESFEVNTNIDIAEKILEINKKIATVEDEKKELNLQIDALNKKIVKAESDKEKAVAKKEEKLNIKEEEIKELRKEIKNLKNELDKYKNNFSLSKDELLEKENLINTLNEKIVEYEKLNKNLSEDNERITNKNIELNNSINSLNNSSAVKFENEYIKNQGLDNKIINLLIENKFTANEIMLHLNTNGANYTFDEIFAAIQRIQKEINIEPTREITIPKVYEIQKPEFVTNKQVAINPIKDGYKDILFISDLHIGNNSEENVFLYRRLYGMYDYCAKNGIDTIINLGDIVDSEILETKKNIDNLDSHKKYISDIANNLYNENILNKNVHQLILGGNHDKRFAKFGIDPIQYIAHANPTIIPIGYEDARIKITDTDDFIGLHHSGVPREESLDYDNQKITEATLAYLNKYYSKLGLSQDKVFVDFFGHTHKGKFDPQNSYGIIPSFSHDRFNDGATKVRIYFDANGNIDYLLIYPLTIGKRIEQLCEIPYQRKRAL